MAKAKINVAALANQIADCYRERGGYMSGAAYQAWIDQTKEILGSSKLADATENGRGGYDLFAFDEECGCEWIF